MIKYRRIGRKIHIDLFLKDDSEKFIANGKIYRKYCEIIWIQRRMRGENKKYFSLNFLPIIFILINPFVAYFVYICIEEILFIQLLIALK
jgi:hypothetical protein